MKRAIPLPLLFAACASCTLPAFGLEPRYGPVNIGGEIGVDPSSASADNSVGEAGIDDDSGAGSLRGDFEWPGSHLTVTLRRSTHDGSGTLGADLSQGSTTIPAGTDVVTDFDLGLHTAYWTFDLVSGEKELGLGFGLAAVDLDYQTTDTAGTSTISFDETLPVPFLAARGGLELGRVELEALAGFVALAALEEEYHFVDLDLQGRLRLFGSAERATGWVTLGLRYTDLDFEYDFGSEDVAADMTITGPYLGLRILL